jgi:membrane protein required for colicin V production
MEFLGISVFDLAVLGVLSLTAIAGLATGIVKSGLFVGSWLLSVLAALYLYPYSANIVSGFFAQEWAVMLTAALGPFLIVLIITSFISQLIIQRVRTSSLNVVDRGLGLAAGLGSGIIAVAVAYMPLQTYFGETEEPDWIRDAKSKPMVEQISAWARARIPDDILERGIDPSDIYNPQAASSGGGPDTGLAGAPQIGAPQIGTPQTGSRQTEITRTGNANSEDVTSGALAPAGGEPVEHLDTGPAPSGSSNVTGTR